MKMIKYLFWKAIKDGKEQRALNICTLHKEHFTDWLDNEYYAVNAIEKGFGDVAKTLLSYNNPIVNTYVVHAILDYITEKGLPRNEMDVDTGDDTGATRDVQEPDKAIAMYIACKPYLLGFLNTFAFTEDYKAKGEYLRLIQIGQWTLDECNESLEVDGSYVNALWNVALQNGGWYATEYNKCKFEDKISGGDDISGMDSEVESDDLLASDDEREGAGGDSDVEVVAGFIDRCLII